MNELIVGGAGSGKTRALARRVLSYRGAALILSPLSHGAERLAELSGKEAFTPYGAAIEIIKSVTGLPPECGKAAKKEKKSRFSSPKEYETALLLDTPVSLCGEEMKSFGEVEIANFLFESKIDYIYEAPYKKDTRTPSRAQYRPDFYLCDYDIYIEYFAIDRDGAVPEYFADRGEYIESMKWKFDLHRREGTKLIDLYAYERAEGTLIKTLAARLEKQKVKIRHRRRGELYPKSPEVGGEDGEKCFESVIERALGYVSEKKYDCPYRHIFVDDMDYMSVSARALIEALCLPVTFTAADEKGLDFSSLTRIGEKGREPKVHFLFSYSERGELRELERVLGDLCGEKRTFIIGRTKETASFLTAPPFKPCYDREKGCVRVRYMQNDNLNISFFSAVSALGRECDTAVIFAEGFGEEDTDLFRMVCSRAREDVYIISKTGAESPAAQKFRVARGAEDKKSFKCPKCGAPMSLVNGKYGEFLGCRKCNFKKKL